MRRVSLGAAIAWLSVAAGGCAAITGLDQLQKEDCLPTCEGGSGGDAPLDSPGDKTMGGDVADSPMTNDVAQETMGMDGSGGEGGSDADAADSPPDVPPDVPFDGPACESGVLGDANNCGGCGMACDPLSAKITKRACMNNMSCSYTCAKGYTSCPVNGDGCGCSTPNVANASCCNGSCPVAHQWDENMVGTDFFDCENTYDMQLAKDACTAFTGDATQCGNFIWQCQGPDGGATGELSICSDGANAASCRCWSYTNPNQGYTDDLNMKQPNCPCPDPMFGSQPYK